MKARDVIGKKIVAIQQEVFWNAHIAKNETAVSAIVLEDGTRLVPIATETVDQPLVTILVCRPRRPGRKT